MSARFAGRRFLSLTSHRVENPDERIVRRGLRAPYHWLTITGDVYMGTLLELCPEAVLNRYLAVTSFDSGVRRITEDERLAGWHLRGEIAYSPRVASVQSLQFQRDGIDSPGYDEWYVFEVPHDLGQVFRGNPFEFQSGCGEILVFVNTLAFALHDPDSDVREILDLFWNQLMLIEPETFIADGRDCLALLSKRPQNGAWVADSHGRCLRIVRAAIGPLRAC
jgi:hypothetical protein